MEVRTEDFSIREHLDPGRRQGLARHGGVRVREEEVCDALTGHDEGAAPLDADASPSERLAHLGFAGEVIMQRGFGQS